MEISQILRMQVTLPVSDPSKVPHPSVFKFLRTRCGTGDVKCAVNDLRDIGKFVARIIADERTLNRYVFCWTQQVTQNEAFALAERISGQKIEIEDVSADEIVSKIKQAKGAVEVSIYEYAYSVWIRGDNTVENAKKPEYGGALDARELYPEIGKELRSLEDYAKELYSS